MPTDQQPAALLVTKRAILDIVRAATLGSYGVAGFAAPLPERLLGWLGLASPGIRLDRSADALSIDLDLVVSHGLPIAEVARQVDSAVRYAIRRALGREISAISIHVDRLHFRTDGGLPAATAGEGSARPARPA